MTMRALSTVSVLDLIGRTPLLRLRGLANAKPGVEIYAKAEFHKEVYSRFGKPHRRTFDGGVDVVVNFTGGDTWVPSLRSLKRGGRLLTCGATAGFDPKEDLRFIWTFELKVLGSNSWAREDLVALLDAIAAGKFEPVVDTVLPLDEAHEGLRLIEERAVIGKVIIKP